MKKTLLFLATVAAAGLLLRHAPAPAQAQAQSTYKPKRVNKAVELLAEGQPIYYTAYSPGGGGGGGARGGKGGGAAPPADAYEAGKQMAQTWADYINYEMEHGAFDFVTLRDFMRGLVDGGPTKSGHRTPGVIVTLPVLGLDEAYMKANSWVVQQTLAAGVHGILLCHAQDPDAIKWLVRASRYINAKPMPGVGEGLQGSGSQSFASRMWGLSTTEYMRKADPWPLNPDGELLLGLKIEDKHALANAEKVASVPGVGFAEWGPGDMGLSLATPGEPPLPQSHARMVEARSRVLAACKKAKIAFLNTVGPNDVEAMIKEGVMIGAGGQAAAEAGRKFTKRAMPW